MFLFLRFIPVLSSLITASTLILNKFYPNLFWFILFFNSMVILGFSFLLNQKSYLEQKNSQSILLTFFYALLPIFLVLSTHGFILPINTDYLFLFAVFIMSIFIFIYFETIFLYLYYPSKYQIHSKENISEYISLVILFFSFSSFFSLIIFINAKIWIFTILIFIITFCLQYHNKQINQIKNKNNIAVSIITTIIITELFITTNFLPTNTYVNASFLTLSYYLINSINKNLLLNSFTKKLLLQHIIVFIILVSLIFSTARFI